MNKDKHIQIRVTQEEKAAIERIAKVYKLNKSELLKLAIAKLINEYEKNNIEGENYENWNENSKLKKER